MSEELFKFLDDLFATGASLKNWDSNKNLLRSCSFDDFWGLIWQLQIAKLFCDKQAVQVEWMKSGPDLKVKIDDKAFFVECYTYRKCFGIEAFIEELCNHINQKIRVKHALCIQFGLPNDAASLEIFLNELFTPYLDSAFLQSKLNEAQFEYPILLPIPNGADNFYVYVEGSDANKYVPGRIPSATGDPEVYLEHVMEEALNNKRNSNRIADHRPNLLGINYLLDQGFQMALNRQRDLGLTMPTPEFGTTFDMVLFVACGIDEIPLVHNYLLATRPGQEHPALGLLGLFDRPTQA
jgi:hypothetical protein